MSALLGSQFWDKLSQISNTVGMNPGDLLAVMYYESGLDPSAHNKNGNASGLIQFMPRTLKDMGYKGDHEDFRKLDALKQLNYIQEYIDSKAKFNGGGFKSAAQYYVANLWPVALKLPGVQQESPNTVIIDGNPLVARYPGVSLRQEKEAYAANAGLDLNKDGKISYGDLQSVMANVKKSAGYRQALSSLSAGQDFIAGKNNPTPAKPKNDNSFYQNLDGMLDQFLSAVAMAETNHLVIQVKSSDVINSLEFARILCIALDEEINATTNVYTNNQDVEVRCAITGPAELSLKATAQFSEALASSFKLATRKLGGIDIETKVFPQLSKSAEETKQNYYQKLDMKVALASYRQFQLKFIKGNGKW